MRHVLRKFRLINQSAEHAVAQRETVLIVFGTVFKSKFVARSPFRTLFEHASPRI